MNAPAEARASLARPAALAVLGDLPHPPRSGNHLRDLQTLAILQDLGYDVHVVAGVRTAGARGVGPAGVLAAAFDVADEPTTPAGRFRRVVRLLVRSGRSGQPGPWALAYEDAGLTGQVERVVARVDPAVVVLRSGLAHLAPALRRRTRTLVLDAHDSEVLLARSILSVSRPLQRIGGIARVVAAARLERVMSLADEIWVTSPREERHFRRRGSRARVLVVPIGVPVPDRLPRRDPSRELLLIAGFGYPPNEAAAIRLVERILPLVLARESGVTVTLVGRDLNPKLVRRWIGRPVRWAGVVDDLAPLYAAAAAAVLPYDASTATGTPLKVAEAIANGVPVVATPNATEALGLESGRHVLTAETDDGLARAIAALLADRQVADELAREAHAWARENLAPDRLADRLRTQSVLGSSGRP